MNSNDYLIRSGDFENTNFEAIKERLTDKNIEILHATLGMAGEVGEFVDAFKKHIMYGKPLDIQHIKEESGDILWYMAVLLRSIDSSFEEIMRMNHEKLSKRYPEGYSDGHAQLRLDKK